MLSVHLPELTKPFDSMNYILVSCTQILSLNYCLLIV